MLSIRPGRDKDAAGFIRLIGDCWAEYPGCVMDVDGEARDLRALATHFATLGGRLWAAERDGAIVGMVATYPAVEAWQIARMYVAAAERGTGLARRLLALAEDHARSAGAHRMVLWSDTRFLRAHAFYEKQGYVRTGGLMALNDLSRSIEAGYAKPLTGLVVQALDVAAAESAESLLADILVACVDEGASVSFLPPLQRDQAAEYWRGVSRAVASGRTVLLAAWREGVLAGAAPCRSAWTRRRTSRTGPRSACCWWPPKPGAAVWRAR
ncbi:MAG: GNAT family N-acetyltransferase [Acetobacteraceae bacterium]